MKKSVKMYLVLCLFVAGSLSVANAQNGCSGSGQYGSCYLSGSGLVNAGWTLNCPTGNLYYNMEAYAGPNGESADANIWGDGPNETVVANIFTPYDRKYGYLSGLQSSLNIDASAYSLGGSAYLSVTLW